MRCSIVGRRDGIDIDEAPAHEQLETLPEFDGDLDASAASRAARGRTKAAPSRNAARRWSYASRRDSPSGKSRCTSGCPRRWRRSTWRRRLVIVDAAWRGWVESMNFKRRARSVPQSPNRPASGWWRTMRGRWMRETPRRLRPGSRPRRSTSRSSSACRRSRAISRRPAPILSTPSRRFSRAHGPRTNLRSNPPGRA